MKCRIALAQMDPVLGDLAKNVARHVELAEAARESGAGLVCFPELSLTGYGVKDLHTELALGSGRNSGAIAPLLEVSRRISIVAGGIEWAGNGAVHNAAFLFEGGAHVVAHRKVYPPTYGMFEEVRYFSKGSRIEAVETAVGRLGVVICEDAWHVSVPYLMALDGAELILSLVASPTRLGTQGFPPQAVNTEHSRAHARLLSVYFAFCNRTGYEDGVNFWGGSHVIAPDGEVLCSAPLFEDALIYADIDGDRLKKARVASRHFLDEDVLLTQHELRRIIDRHR
jgi:predicted amidohydrolase